MQIFDALVAFTYFVMAVRALGNVSQNLHLFPHPGTRREYLRYPSFAVPFGMLVGYS